MPTSLADVAQAAGVSIATASRVLAGSKHPVAESTRRKVLNAAARIGYQPNLIARGLRIERTYTIGIVVENLLSPFVPPIVRGIQTRLVQDGYMGMVFSADLDPRVEHEAVEALIRRQIDGIIFVESWLWPDTELPGGLSQPYVFVHRPVRSSGPNSIIADDCLGAGLAMRHLVAMGHRRIAHISGPADWDAAQRRIRGYEDGMMDLGLPIDADLIVPGDWEMQTGYAAGQRLAALDDPPSAIFAANDLMAVGAIYALQDAGLGVPDDVAVVGYDDREICGVTRPSVTSVRMPTHEMGYAAADLLLRMCDGAQGVEHPVRVAGQLVIRDSCGARQGSPGFEPERGSIARALLLSRATQIDQLSRGGNRNARFHEAEHT